MMGTIRVNIFDAIPRYHAREDCVLDSFGGARSFRVVPIMGQSPVEVGEIARLAADALNNSGAAR